MSRFKKPATSSDDDDDHAPRVNKDPYYRTTDIFNGVFKKKVRLESSKSGNSTDLKTIYVNFGETKPSPIRDFVREGRDDAHSIYRLECGHDWEGKAGHPLDGSKWGSCWTCGSAQSYLGFEHEWQHIIFKTDIVAKTLFVNQYIKQLTSVAPNVDAVELERFLHYLVNAFDDIRVNSLWEKVYPGSAWAIWDRWRWYTAKSGDDVNKSFLSYVFAIALGIDTNPKNEFQSMRKTVEWGVQTVRYRGFQNMLITVRAVLDHCMGALLSKFPPQPKLVVPPPPPSLAMPGSPQDKNDGQGQKNTGATPSPKQGQEDSGNASGGQAANGISDNSRPNDGQSKNGENEGQHGSGGLPVPNNGPSQLPGDQEYAPAASSLNATPEERSDALNKLISSSLGAIDGKRNSGGLDGKEEHKQSSSQELLDATKKSSVALNALVGGVLNTDIQDLKAIHDKMGDGVDGVDYDMQQQIEQLKKGIAQKSESSQLTDNAKAKVLLIDVTRAGVPDSSAVQLTDVEVEHVKRMRAAFFKAMGRKKMKRSAEGTSLDMQAFISYKCEKKDIDVFEYEELSKGFAYSLLCDMSGSMQGIFPFLCHAAEMLRQSLDYPFVEDHFWGFRGGEYRGASPFRGGAEVWMYKYRSDVKGYHGHATVKKEGSTFKVPVQCGGITPMNAAINVTTAHLHKKVPAGMAKRLYLLTDGSPAQAKVDGGYISEVFLRKLVAKEIEVARRHAIQVYTLVIGDGIDEKECLQMFGPRRFWRKVATTEVASALAHLVLDDFQKYLRSR